MPKELGAVIANLMEISDEAWGLLIIERDRSFPFYNEKHKQEILNTGNIFGIVQAESIAESYQNREQFFRSNKLRVRIGKDDDFANPSQTNFAQYQNSEILLSSEMLDNLEDIWEKNCLEDSLGNKDKIKQILIAHELYHFFEDRDPRKENAGLKLPIKIGFIKKKISPQSAGEIAAFSFAKKLLDLNYHPCILEYLGLRVTNQKLANQMLEQVTHYQQILNG